MIVCYYHVTYAFESKSTLYTSLNVKEVLAWNRRDIWSLSDRNGIRTHNHLVCLQTLNHLVSLGKCLSVCLWTKWLWVRTVKKNKKLLNIPKLHISLSFSCSSVIFRYFLLIIADAMNAGAPITKYIQIYPYYTTQPGNFDGKPTYLPLPHTFYSKRAVILVIFWNLLHWMQYYMLKREQKKV